MNLMKNAVEASPENGKVEVEFTELDSMVSIQIKNQGAWNKRAFFQEIHQLRKT